MRSDLLRITSYVAMAVARILDVFTEKQLNERKYDLYNVYNNLFITFNILVDKRRKCEADRYRCR